MNVTLAATALGLAAVFGYPLLCAASPFGRCWRCKGDGARRTRRGQAKPCRRCRTTGRRLRIGRRVYNRANALQAAAQKGPTR